MGNQDLSVTQTEIRKRFFRRRYLHGWCHIMALVMHDGLGKPVVYYPSKQGLIHAGVRMSPRRKFIDARGVVSLPEFGGPYGLGNMEPLDVSRTDFCELFLDGYSQRVFVHADNSARVLLPDLPGGPKKLALW